MILKPSLTTLLALGLCVQGAAANCKAPPERYDLLDLGDVVAGHAESRAVAIDERGRVIVRTVPPGMGTAASEYEIAANGKARLIQNPDELAQRETVTLVGDRVRLTDYLLVQEGFLPARTKTLIDRKGGEIDIKDYCKPAGESDWTLETFVISDNGDKAAGLFKSSAGYMVGMCGLDENVKPLFETSDRIELAGINNAGELGGLLGSGQDLFLWRWADGNRVTQAVPEALLGLDVEGIDRQGRVYALATGEILNPVIYLGQSDELSPALVLPGEGWDVNWVTLGPCGTLMGEATYTNFATFIQLPEEERYRMRQNFSEFWQYALERETEVFVWSPDKRTGRFLGAVAKDTRDWSDLKITAINENGIAVGSARNDIGQMRAIKLVPAKD